MDVVTRLITLLDTAPRDSWERVLRAELGGRRLYIACSTGREQVRQLREWGLSERTARWKVRAR